MQWQAAINSELASHEQHGTWQLVDRPDGVRVHPGGWVFAVKRDSKGNITRYKARYVGKGYNQRLGVDYTDTYVPMMRIESLRSIIAALLGMGEQYIFRQMDIKTAYLHAELDQPLFIQPPQGLRNADGKVCMLVKGLYGMKQSGMVFNRKLKSVLVDKMAFTQSAVDQAVYFRRRKGQHVILGTHVDDAFEAGNSDRALDEFEREFEKYFETSFQGELSWLLSIAFKHDLTNGTVSMSQCAYIDSLLDRFGMACANPVQTPMDASALLNSSQCPATDDAKAAMAQVPYRELVGSLMYLSTHTRPDIAYTVNTLAQFMQNPGRAHWEAGKRVLRYLKKTRDYQLTFGHVRGPLEGFSDADWGSSDHRHSISGTCILLNGGAVSYSSQKQSIIALSTAEAECLALVKLVTDATFITNLLSEIVGAPTEPLLVNCDNQSAIALSKSTQFHQRSKHIDMRFKFVREAIANETIDIDYCPTDYMPADILTKPLRQPKVGRFARMLGLLCAIWLEGEC